MTSKTVSTQKQTQRYVLSLQCPDRVGVVARTTQLLMQAGAFITDIANYSDPVAGSFHFRCEFDDRSMNPDLTGFRQEFDTLAAEFAMQWRLRALLKRCRVMIAVSHYDHCLIGLLTKWRAGALPADIVGVVSNHEACRAVVDWHELPFHYLPVTPQTKPAQESQLLALMEAHGVELLVLARYMQVLSDAMCEQLQGRAINIHHSFLPGFKGARPYHQAYERGVKVIGATAHYVTAELDEGPIIVQEVRAIDHRVTVRDMIHLGHDTEATALAHAVRLHCEDRVQLAGQRTIIL